MPDTTFPNTASVSVSVEELSETWADPSRQFLPLTTVIDLGVVPSDTAAEVSVSSDRTAGDTVTTTVDFSLRFKLEIRVSRSLPPPSPPRVIHGTVENLNGQRFAVFDLAAGLTGGSIMTIGGRQVMAFPIPDGIPDNQVGEFTTVTITAPSPPPVNLGAVSQIEVTYDAGTGELTGVLVGGGIVPVLPGGQIDLPGIAPNPSSPDAPSRPHLRCGVSVQLIRSAIQDKYNQLGGAAGFLGKATTGLIGSRDGVGLQTDYQGGSIYFHPATGAHEIHGAIRDKWVALGAETGILEYPTTDVAETPNGGGLFSQFQGGAIYWSAAIGAHYLTGPILVYWLSLGGPTSYLRFSTTDVTKAMDGNQQYVAFQRGKLLLKTDNTVEEFPESLTKNPGPFGTGHLGGTATLQLWSNGTWILSGNIHEGGFFGDKYAVAFALNIRDPQGKAPGWTFQGSAHGFIGNPDSEIFQNNQNEQYLIDNWDAIRDASLLWNMQATTDPIDVLEVVLGGLVAAAAVVGIVVFVSDPKTVCKPYGAPSPNGSGGEVGVICRRDS